MTTLGAISNTATPVATTTGSGLPAVSEEYNTFIKLLTAQMRNQDPLAPLDSTAFVEQLATFSGLEQQVSSNAHLERIASMMGNLSGLAAGQWLGQPVSIQSSWVPYSGNSVQFASGAPDGTARSVLTIRNSAGTAIWTETLDPSASVHAWSGNTQTGAPAQAGLAYQFSIDAYDAAGQYMGSSAPRVIAA